jgi:hypothetical protein
LSRPSGRARQGQRARRINHLDRVDIHGPLLPLNGRWQPPSMPVWTSRRYYGS